MDGDRPGTAAVFAGWPHVRARSRYGFAGSMTIRPRPRLTR